MTREVYVYISTHERKRRIKCLMESHWYLDDCTEISPDGPSESSSDSISFNGQLVNPMGDIIHPGGQYKIRLTEVKVKSAR